MRRLRIGLFSAAVVLVLAAVGNRPAEALIDIVPGSLAGECQAADAIAVLKVEKVDRAKKAIVYRKVRDLKGTYTPASPGAAGDTFTHVIGPIHNPGWHLQDLDTEDLQNEAILARAAEGKTAVVFERRGWLAVCVGHAWYTARLRQGSADSRLQRVFCGDAEALIAGVSRILAGREAAVPRMVGTTKVVTDHSGPILRTQGVRFLPQSPWSTHRGNAQRTGGEGPGPKRPTVVWVHQSTDHFIAPVLPGTKGLFASAIGPFNTPSVRALALGPAGDKQVLWTRGAPLLRQPIAAAPALLGGPTEMLVFGDGFHMDEGSSLRCVRTADGFPLWQLAVPGPLVHFEGTPTAAGGKLYVGGGNAGVLCLEPGRVTFEGKEQDLPAAQAALEQRWKELLARCEVEKKKDPEFAPRPDESMLPLPAPKRIWQAGQERWHVDAPVVVVADRVLAASASLEDEKAGERALVCLKAEDGSVLWKTPLKLNPWAGPTAGPYVLVGCSSIRLDPGAVPGARGEVVAVEWDTGAVRWRREVPGGVVSSVAVKAGLAVFTATDGKVRAWDAFTGAERWTYNAGAPFFAGPAVTGTTVYAAGLDGVVHAVGLADGKRQWRLDLRTDPATKASGMVYGSPAVHGDRLYLATCRLGQGAGRAANVVVCIGDQ
jgi:outer membrane protein assembly factor BamB